MNANLWKYYLRSRKGLFVEFAVLLKLKGDDPFGGFNPMREGSGVDQHVRSIRCLQVTEQVSDLVEITVSIASHAVGDGSLFSGTRRSVGEKGRRGQVHDEDGVRKANTGWRVIYTHINVTNVTACLDAIEYFGRN